MFRDTMRTAHARATRLFGHARTIASHVERALGTAARVYHTLAPALAPLAMEHLGEERAQRIHGAVSSGLYHGQRIAGAIKYP